MTPKHHESDKHVHRGRITKQGSRLVRWAAIESVQILPKTSVVGRIRDRVGDRRGRNIGVVAAARRQLEFVFYALRDHRVRALQGTGPVAAPRRCRHRTGGIPGQDHWVVLHLFVHRTGSIQARCAPYRG